jgi:hypothetical protein
MFYELAVVLLFGYLGMLFDNVINMANHKYVRIIVLAFVYSLIYLILSKAIGISTRIIIISALSVLPVQTWHIISAKQEDFKDMLMSWQTNLGVLIACFICVAFPLGLLDQFKLISYSMDSTVLMILGFWGALYFLYSNGIHLTVASVKH